MDKLQSFIKQYCLSNRGKKEIDFNLLKDPGDLYNRFGAGRSENQFKGDVLEMLLEELFRGNGYIVERLGEGGKDAGCDLLIKYPQDNAIRFVLQAKNWSRNIEKPIIQMELQKFKDNYQRSYNLNHTNFCFVAWNYVKDIKSILKYRLNIKVWDEHDIIQNLFKNYKPAHPKAPEIILEPYQESAYKNILEFWTKNQRCYVEHATGTGKTYIIGKLSQRLLENADNKILILSPSVYINERIEKLLSCFMPSNNIAKSFHEDKQVYLLTYQYLMFGAKKKTPSGNFTHIIMDEAHRAGAPIWHKEGLSSVIGSVTRLVGLSATMQRYTGGIDIKSFLGNNCAGELSLFAAMARGILPLGDYVYSVLGIKSEIEELKTEVKNKYNRNQVAGKAILEKLDSREIKEYDLQKIIYKYYGEHKYSKIIAFCEEIEHIYDIQAILAKTFSKFGKIRRFEVHSGWPRKDNGEQLDKFSNTIPRKKEIYVLTAVNMLNEGIDVAGIDSVMLFRKTESPRIYFQQIGRCIRRHGVERPLIFDCVLNYQSVNISYFEEANKEFNKYRADLASSGFEDIEVPTYIRINDEVKTVSEIIREVEKRLNFYPTLEEAKIAVQKIGIKNIKEYAKEQRYKEDPRLPSNPNTVYKDWVDWDDYLGKPSYYPTYELAKQAAQRFEFSSASEYRKYCEKDPHLPFKPYDVYDGRGWIDWYDFLGKPNKNIYSTYKSAKLAAKRLNIINSTEYLKRKRYKEDPRLPAAPDVVYKNKGWVNWNAFFGKKDLYSTYEEAKEAVQGLGIKRPMEYHRLRKKNARLPALPRDCYKDKGWINWDDFFGK